MKIKVGEVLINPPNEIHFLFTRVWRRSGLSRYLGFQMSVNVKRMTSLFSKQTFGDFLAFIGSIAFSLLKR